MKSEVCLECLPLESLASGNLTAALREGPSRITIRLFNEASSALAYLHRLSYQLYGGSRSEISAQFPNNSSTEEQILESICSIGLKMRLTGS